MGQNSGEIPITVRLFAQYREATGTSTINMSIPNSSSVSDVLELLFSAHPSLSLSKSSTVVAVNQSYAEHNYILQAHDELALIPPVSGGSMNIITADKIDVEGISKSLKSDYNGSILCFQGVARKYTNEDRVIHLEYEAYNEMAEKLISQIIAEAKNKFQIDQVIIQHRIGIVKSQETSLVVCVSSPHRKASFLAIPWIVDKIKTDVPIWKKEVFENRQEWVACEITHSSSTC